MAKQFLENASLNLDREYFEEYIEEPVSDEVWEQMQNIQILEMEDWYEVYQTAQMYLKAITYVSQEELDAERKAKTQAAKS